jgi:putative tricarboxylic transport membrane protein
LEETVSLSVLPSLLFFVLGLVYTTATVMLPDASIGRAYEPKIFPFMLGFILLVLSLGLIARELKEVRGKNEKESAPPFYKESGFNKILMTCVFAVLYALIFNKAGYVISTIIFLELELILFNGKENWKVNTAVALVFSLFIYIIFSKVLGVFLPLTPGLWI